MPSFEVRVCVRGDEGRGLQSRHEVEKENGGGNEEISRDDNATEYTSPSRPRTIPLLPLFSLTLPILNDSPITKSPQPHMPNPQQQPAKNQMPPSYPYKLRPRSSSQDFVDLVDGVNAVLYREWDDEHGDGG